MFGKFGYLPTPGKNSRQRKCLRQINDFQFLLFVKTFFHISLNSYLAWEKSFKNLFSFGGRQNFFLFSAFLEERFRFTWWPGVQAFMPSNFGRKFQATNMLKYVKTFSTVYKNAKNLQIFRHIWRKRSSEVIYALWAIYHSKHRAVRKPD